MHFFSVVALFCAAAASEVAAKRAADPRIYDKLVADKVLKTFKTLPAPSAIRYPQYTNQSGTWLLFHPNTWTSGFFPGTMYALDERARVCGATAANGLDQANWVNLGQSISTGLIPLTISNNVGHDLGFIAYPFVDEVALRPSNATAVKLVNTFATNLAKRFNAKVGAIRSWGEDPEIDFQVIADNMMNLELLYVSAALTGNNTLRNIARIHADTTIAQFIRPDGGSFHVVHFNATTGAVTRKRTAQGYADSSTWSRGEAWLIYGFATMYQYTKVFKYLETARRLANYFIANIPTDGIVPWDFNAPVAGRASDSSAAMIAARGLLLMAKYEPSVINAAKWRNAALKIVNDMTAFAFNPAFESILSNGTVNIPAGNSRTGTVYGDYYFIRVGTEFVRQGLATC